MSNDNLNPMAESPMEFLINAVLKEMEGIPMANEQLFFSIYSKQRQIHSRKDLIASLFQHIDFATVKLSDLNYLDGIKADNRTYAGVLVTPEQEGKINEFRTEFSKLFLLSMVNAFNKFPVKLNESQKKLFDEKISEMEADNMMITGHPEYMTPYTNHISSRLLKRSEPVGYWFEDKSDNFETLYRNLLKGEYIMDNPHFIDSFRKFNVPKNYRTKWIKADNQLVFLIYLLADEQSLYKNIHVTIIAEKLFVGEDGSEFQPKSLRSALSIIREKRKKLPARIREVKDLFDSI